MSFCAFLLLLAGCCLLGIKDPDGHAPIPDHPLFRWHEGWLPLGLALLFTCHAYGPGVGTLVWFGLFALSGALAVLFLAFASPSLREWASKKAVTLTRLLFFPAVLLSVL